VSDLEVPWWGGTGFSVSRSWRLGDHPGLCLESAVLPSALEQTAIHEAAHVVIATLIHRGIVDEVFISETPVNIGDLFDEVNLGDYGLMGGTRFRKIRTTLFQQGLIAYSGFFAQCEQLFQGGIELDPLLPELRSQASHDVDRYLALLRSANLPDAEIRDIIINVGSMLKHYFDSGVWPLVIKVAAALLDRGHLSGEEVLELLQEVPLPETSADA
jgi:hypothetical protein